MTLRPGRDPWAGWRDRDPADIVPVFCRRFADELADRTARGLETAFLRRYYSKLFGPDGRPMLLAVRGYSERLRLVLDELRRRPDGVRLIDAGSGYGTESLLFAALGAEVSGVELRADLADRARSRIGFHRAAADRSFRLDFVNANILRYLGSAGPADLIWAMESISHIYPPEKFLALAFDRLRPGGALIVSDPNTLNPYAWLSGIRIRGSLRHAPKRIFTDPWSGEVIDYGQENRFRVGTMTSKMKTAGFQIRAVHMSGFLGSTLWPPRLAARPFFIGFMTDLQNAARKAPLLARLGSNYTILAAKEP